MIKVFKRWLAAAAYEGLSQPKEEARINKLHDMLSNNMAAMVAFKIDNGFIVRTMDTDNMLRDARPRGFVYCADHQAIADHLIASAARNALGVQQDLFEQEQADVIRPTYSAAIAKSLGTAFNTRPAK